MSVSKPWEVLFGEDWRCLALFLQFFGHFLVVIGKIRPSNATQSSIYKEKRVFSGLTLFLICFGSLRLIWLMAAKNTPANSKPAKNTTKRCPQHHPILRNAMQLQRSTIFKQNSTLFENNTFQELHTVFNPWVVLVAGFCVDWCRFTLFLLFSGVFCRQFLVKQGQATPSKMKNIVKSKKRDVQIQM